MSNDRDLVERLAAIDATPRASWVAELRADLNAAWETEDVGYLHSLRTTTVTLVDHEPPPARPTSGRRWQILIAAAAAAAVVLVVGALVVVDSDDSEIEVPGAPPSTVPSTTTVDTSSTELVVPPLDSPIECELELCPWSPELTAQALEFPIPCNRATVPSCPDLAVSPDGTLVAFDPAAGTLTWYEEVPRVVSLTPGLVNTDFVDANELVAVGPHDIAYIVSIADGYIVAVAPSGAEITRVTVRRNSRQPAYRKATGLVNSGTTWLVPNGEPAMPWVDLDGNPITDPRPYPTATVTDAGIEVHLGEREWLLTEEAGTRLVPLEFLARSDGGVVMVLDASEMGDQTSNLLELSPDGSIGRYFVDLPAIALPDGSLIVEYGAQLVRLSPAGFETVGAEVNNSPLQLVHESQTSGADVELFRVTTDEPSYWRLTTLPEFDGRTWRLPSRELSPINDTADPEPDGRTIRQQVQILALQGQLLPAAADPKAVEPNTDIRLNPDTSTLVKTSELEYRDQFTIVSEVIDVAVDELWAATADNPPDDLFRELPDNVPGVVSELATEVTAGAKTDYGRLIAMQNWFHTFDYSTDVASGHGSNAIAIFLQTRIGYCEQFAAAFAVMARTLGIPSRVAVGFTSGELNAEGSYSIFGKHSHAWPEVWFDGIGWVPFEPTPSRGIPGAEDDTGVEADQQPAP